MELEHGAGMAEPSDGQVAGAGGLPEGRRGAREDVGRRVGALPPGALALAEPAHQLAQRAGAAGGIGVLEAATGAVMGGTKAHGPGSLMGAGSAG